MSESQLTAKQLAPLIAIIVLIIILTLIIRGSRLSEPEKNTQVSDSTPLELRLSPFYLNPRKNSSGFSSEPFHAPALDEIMATAANDMEHHRYAEAEDRLRTALIFYPESRSSLTMLGAALYNQRKYKAAEDIYRQLTQLDPENTEAYNNLGAALARQQKYQEAIDSMKKLQVKNPNSPYVDLNLSSIYSITGNTAEALKHFQKAYDSLSERILPLSYDSNFDNIRKERLFQKIVKEADSKYRRKQALEKKGKTVKP